MAVHGAPTGQALTRLGAKWQTEAAVGGVRADYLAELPDDQRVVIELKRPRVPSALENYSGARGSAARRRGRRSRCGVAVFAAPHIEATMPGAVGYADLEAAISARPQAQEHDGARPAVMKRARSVFVAMPFAASYEDTYFGAMLGAAEDAGAACQRLDREEYAGDIVAKLREPIRRADAVIADLSGANVNVAYEVRYAYALEVPTIHVCCTPRVSLRRPQLDNPAVRGWAHTSAAGPAAEGCAWVRLVGAHAARGASHRRTGVVARRRGADPRRLVEAPGSAMPGAPSAAHAALPACRWRPPQQRRPAQRSHRGQRGRCLADDYGGEREERRHASDCSHTALAALRRRVRAKP